MTNKKIFRLGTLLTALAATALLFAATGSSRSNAAVTLRASVGPGFTINLTDSGGRVKSLKGGTYKFVINDRSSEHNFELRKQGGRSRELTSVSFIGTKTVTVKLSKGVWTFFCDPHASMMFGRFAVGGASFAASRTTTTTTTDDRGGGRPAEPGDDRGGHGEPEPGDDRGGRASSVATGVPTAPGAATTVDDRGGHGEPEPGDDRGGR
jgi:plastocyanin